MNGLKQFGKGIFWFGVGAVGQGGQVWRDIVSTCKEFSDNKELADGQSCVWSILETTFHAAVYAQGSYQTAITFANVMQGALAGGNGKRDDNHSKNWASRWSSFSTEQKDQLRSQMRQVNRNINLHSVGDGSPNLDNSLSLFISHGDKDATGPYIRHVTNGTHGFTHPVSPQQQKSPIHARADTSWGFGNNVAGLKFSYDRPCIGEVVVDTVQNGDDYVDSIVAFEQYAAANPSDRWTIEWDDQQSGNLIMYGTLVAEQSGFGSDYEDPNFNPAGVCSH